MTVPSVTDLANLHTTVLRKIRIINTDSLRRAVSRHELPKGRHFRSLLLRMPMSLECDRSVNRLRQSR